MLEELDELPDEEVAERLMQVRGIGQWTVDMFLIFHLGRPDVLPVGDLGLRRAAMLAYRPAQAAGASAPDTAGPPLAPLALGRHLVPVGLAARRARVVAGSAEPVRPPVRVLSHRPERERPRHVETTVP